MNQAQPIIIVMTDPLDLERVLEQLRPSAVVAAPPAPPRPRPRPRPRVTVMPARRPAAPKKRAVATASKRPAAKRAAPQPRGAVSGKILGALRTGLHDVQAIADSIGAKPGSVRQALHGLIKRKEAVRIGRGRFGVNDSHANGQAAHA